MSATVQAARFAVRLPGRGLVTTWCDEPLTSYELAEQCREAIEDLTGCAGSIERVLLHVPAEGSRS